MATSPGHRLDCNQYSNTIHLGWEEEEKEKEEEEEEEEEDGGPASGYHFPASVIS